MWFQKRLGTSIDDVGDTSRCPGLLALLLVDFHHLEIDET
jgi:hypothetical protein